MRRRKVIWQLPAPAGAEFSATGRPSKSKKGTPTQPLMVNHYEIHHCAAIASHMLSVHISVATRANKSAAPLTLFVTLQAFGKLWPPPHSLNSSKPPNPQLGVKGFPRACWHQHG